MPNSSKQEDVCAGERDNACLDVRASDEMLTNSIDRKESCHSMEVTHWRESKRNPNDFCSETRNMREFGRNPSWDKLAMERTSTITACGWSSRHAAPPLRMT